jgi:hypothetical protein
VDSALTAATLGVFPGVPEDAGHRLIQQLGDIDADERRAGGERPRPPSPRGAAVTQPG